MHRRAFKAIHNSHRVSRQMSLASKFVKLYGRPVLQKVAIGRLQRQNSEIREAVLSLWL